MLSVGVWLVVAAQAATPPPAPPAAPPAPGPAGVGAAGGDYRVGPGDILRVTVYGHEDLSQTVVVEPGGRFVFPLIGPVEAAQATPQDLEARIASRLAKGLIRDPRVTVVVQEYRSKVLHVVGEVSRPGTYPLTGRTTVVEMLARAGPLSPQAATEVIIVRPLAAAPDRPLLPNEATSASAEVLRVDLAALQAGRLERNLDLAAGDTLFVPQAERLFVTGEVRNPGSYPFHSGLTVRQAVSLAGGFSEDASTGGVRVVRGGGPKPLTIKVKLDELLQPGDTVVVKAKLF